jgi:hypothetical protein
LKLRDRGALDVRGPRRQNGRNYQRRESWQTRQSRESRYARESAKRPIGQPQQSVIHDRAEVGSVAIVNVKVAIRQPSDPVAIPVEDIPVVIGAPEGNEVAHGIVKVLGHRSLLRPLRLCN